MSSPGGSLRDANQVEVLATWRARKSGLIDETVRFVERRALLLAGRQHQHEAVALVGVEAPFPDGSGGAEDQQLLAKRGEVVEHIRAAHDLLVLAQQGVGFRTL